jgi:Cu2+-exporting ATPase
MPEPRVATAHEIAPDILEVVARLALSSHHPLARAVAREALIAEPFATVSETSGDGVETDIDGVALRLGSASFCGAKTSAATSSEDRMSLMCFSFGDRRGTLFVRQNLRADARKVIDDLKAKKFKIAILSGDRPSAVEDVARQLGVDDWRGGLKPGDKIAALEEMAMRGAKALMVGDGLNDAPALAAAHVSMSPTSATDLTQAHADAVFVGEQLGPVMAAIEISVTARRLMRENIAMAIGYNVFAVPLAMLGYVTPLIAALAMSGSSIIVCANALRARGGANSFKWLRRTPVDDVRGLKPLEASP